MFNPFTTVRGLFTAEEKIRHTNQLIYEFMTKEIAPLFKKEFGNKVTITAHNDEAYNPKKKFYYLVPSQSIPDKKQKLYRKYHYLIRYEGPTKELERFKEIFIQAFGFCSGDIKVKLIFDEEAKIFAVRKDKKKYRRDFILSHDQIYTFPTTREYLTSKFKELSSSFKYSQKDPTFTPSQEQVYSIDNKHDWRIRGIICEKGKDGVIHYADDILLVTADLETGLFFDDSTSVELQKLVNNKYLKYYKTAEYHWWLKRLLTLNAQAQPYAVAWSEIKSPNLNDVSYNPKKASKIVNFTTDIYSFLKRLWELAKNPNQRVLCIFYNAEYDTNILKPIFDFYFPKGTITFSYTPLVKKKFLQVGCFVNHKELTYLEAQDLYGFYRVSLSAATDFIKGLKKGEIPYNMVNPKVSDSGNYIEYLDLGDGLKPKSYPISNLKEYTVNDIILTNAALKNKVAFLNKFNSASNGLWGKEVWVSDEYGAAAISEACIRSFLQGKKIKGIKSFPAINRRVLKPLLKPKTSRDDYYKMKRGFMGGYTAHNIKFTVENYPDGFKVPKDYIIISIDINSSYPNQMSKPMPMGELYNFKPTWLKRRQEEILKQIEKIESSREMDKKEKEKARNKIRDTHYLAFDSNLPPYPFYLVTVIRDLHSLIPLHSWMRDFSTFLVKADDWKVGMAFIKNCEYIDFLIEVYGKEQFEAHFEVDRKNIKWKFQSRAIGEFINWAYPERQRLKEIGDRVGAQSLKLVLNTLYGKRAQGSFEHSYKYLSNSEFQNFIRIDNCLDEEGGYEDITSGSVIPDRGRIHLFKTFKAIMSAKFLYSIWFKYTDTDSLFLALHKGDLKKFKEVVELDSYKLGAWKIEGIYNRWFCAKNKSYCLLNDNMPESLIKEVGEIVELPKSLSNVKLALGGIDKKERIEGYINKLFSEGKSKEAVDFVKTLWNPNHRVLFEDWGVDGIDVQDAVKKTPLLFPISKRFTKWEEGIPPTHIIKWENNSLILYKLK